MPLLEDAQLNLLTANAFRRGHESDDLVLEGYSQDSFYGDKGEWTRDNRIGLLTIGVSIALYSSEL
jgi:hypothetical protein